MLELLFLASASKYGGFCFAIFGDCLSVADCNLREGIALRVLLALIHNNNLTRIETARKTARLLLGQLRSSDQARVEYLEVFEQEPFPEISGKLWRQIRRISNFSQYRYLRFHLETQTRRWLPFLLAFFTEGVRLPDTRARWRLGVERAVTKNIFRC